MARIRQEDMKITNSATGRKHPAVHCKILRVLTGDGEQLLHINMFGGPNRKCPTVQSQTIQFDAEDARKFRGILDDFLAKVK